MRPHHALAIGIVLFASLGRPHLTSASIVIGTGGAATPQNFTSLSAAANFPTLDAGAWRIWTFIDNPTFAGGNANPTFQATGSTNSGNHIFLSGATDRALGFILPNSTPRSIMVEVKNDTGGVLDSITATWNLEKYRNGFSPLGISFFHSSDGATWQASSQGGAAYSADGNNNALAVPTSQAKDATISGLNLANGALYYLRWEFLRTSGDSLTPGVGIDDVALTGVAAVPEVSSFLATGVAGIAAYLLRKRRRATA